VSVDFSPSEELANYKAMRVPPAGGKPFTTCAETTSMQSANAMLKMDLPLPATTRWGS